MNITGGHDSFSLAGLYLVRTFLITRVRTRNWIRVWQTRKSGILAVSTAIHHFKNPKMRRRGYHSGCNRPGHLPPLLKTYETYTRQAQTCRPDASPRMTSRSRDKNEVFLSIGGEIAVNSDSERGKSKGRLL